MFSDVRTWLPQVLLVCLILPSLSVATILSISTCQRFTDWFRGYSVPLPWSTLWFLAGYWTSLALAVTVFARGA